MRMRINKRWLKGASFPLALFAFSAVGIQYAGSLFTATTRWLFLALLGLTLLKSGRALGVLNTRFGVLVLVYCSWCLLTSGWSIVPELSLLKGLASALTIVLFVAAGRYWATGWTSVQPVYYLAPIAIAAFASAFGGVTQNPGSGIHLYQGLTGNPNYLGLIVASSLPLMLFLIYRAYSQHSTLILRMLYTLGTIILIALLWRAGSRSAIACATCVVAFGIMALRPTKMIIIAIVAVNAIAITAVAAPEIEEQFYTRIIVKYSPDGDILYTRREAWQESMEGASQGGWFGLGYGASYGDTSFSGGLTAVGYGREKGSSQLAVIEEVGIVGGILYALLVLAIFSELLGELRRAPNPAMRMQVALITGLAVGLLVQSAFEAWWTAPGSVESAIFWATVGVGSGLVRRGARIRIENLNRRKTYARIGAVLPNADGV